jgi:hypothetical protein
MTGASYAASLLLSTLRVVSRRGDGNALFPLSTVRVGGTEVGDVPSARDEPVTSRSKRSHWDISL